MSLLNRTTGFIDDAIGIDPAGCGCVDCIIGDSINENSGLMDELAAEVAAGRQVVNRTASSYAVIRNNQGEPEFLQLSHTGSVLYPADEANEWRVSDEYAVHLHRENCWCSSCEAGDTLPADEVSSIDGKEVILENGTSDLMFEYISKNVSYEDKSEVIVHDLRGEVIGFYPYD